ncbi:PPC domain-containing protein [Iningainema tapete]|uniref:Peptidase C-terminal archaeal/bacterial domain-containing protein n=1 Tax=Iningainema tapete BLCC-T55 TaxID=2748662 RepID=A0A8J6XRY2_9CYAN|nr:PPC domain-containing protein [Iningainema tapete]MBD2776406.1 hypothetical protein [Iningainema tapete BLCC-T55]
MPKYKCIRCSHEFISEDLPSGCECCGRQDLFIEYLTYKSLLEEKSSVKTESVPKMLTELETENSKLNKKVSELESEIKTKKSKLDKKTFELESKNKEFTTLKTRLESEVTAITRYKNSLSAIASVTIIGLGILCFNQYQKANRLEREISSSTGDYKEQIKELQNKIEQLSADREKLVTEGGKLGEKVNYYKNLLSYYPFSLSTGQQVIYQGNLVSGSTSTGKQEYQIWVQTASKFDISLYNLTADADLEIVKENGEPLKTSQRTNNSGTASEFLNNFYLNPGSYFIRVKLYGSSPSTSYSLKVYRRPNL